MRRLLCYALCAALPPLVSIASVWFLLDAELGSYWPEVSDDVTLNHQIRTFVLAGFSGGYYTIDEAPAAASFTHFGPHGPFYPVLYGTLLRPFGASVAGPIWVHHGMIYAACFFGFIFARASVVSAFSVAIVTATFWPAISMLTISMQEGLHFSISILAATAVSRGDTLSRWFGVALYCAATSIRSTWVLGYLTLFRRPENVIRLSMQIAGILSLALAAFLIARLISAPVPRGPLDRVQDALGTGGLGLQISNLAVYLYESTLANLIFLLSPSRWQHLEGHVFILSGAVLLYAALARPADWRLQASCFALALAFIAVAVLYDVGSYRGFRVLGPFTLLSLVTGALSANKRLFVPLTVGLNLLFVSPFMQFYSENRGPMFRDQGAELSELSAQLAIHLKFDATADPWCNTVLIDHLGIGAKAAAIPVGFGLSVASGTGALDKPKSAFLMVSPENAQRMISESEFFRVILETEGIVILANSHSGCRAEQ